MSDHALLGSDDSTDAGTGFGLGYADRVRGMMERGRGRPADHGIDGQIMTFRRDIADVALGRPARPAVPLHVRKMASM